MAPALRILLAEDNPGDVFLVQEALRKHCSEFELAVAPDGNRAWSLIESAEADPKARFTFFLLDLNLPVRPGLELLVRIRESKTEMARALVVIVTSSSAPSDQTAAMQAGANHYFCKPSNLDEFLQLGGLVQRLWAARIQSAH